MKVNFYNIMWDVDTDSDGQELPTKTVEVLPDNFDVEMHGADFLSDKYGFCLQGFKFKILKD